MWIAAVSDIHAGSTVAVFPDGDFFQDDGSQFIRSPLQVWLHDNWLSAWQTFQGYVNGDPWILVLNGDLVEGNHHKSHQNASPLGAMEFRAAHRLMRTPLAVPGLQAIHVIRGTEAHVGKAGGNEEAFAAVLAAGDDDLPPQPVVRCPDINSNYSSYWRRFEVAGKLFDVRHHGRFGQRAHTAESYLKLYAQDIALNHIKSGDRPPDIAIRSHYHQFMDSGPSTSWGTRVVALPAWQCLTAFGHRIAIENIAPVGMVAINVRQTGVDVIPILYRPSRPKVVIHD